jgi:hypothetical protein
MTPEKVEALFTRSTGEFLFARWGRPIAPVVFGVEDETLQTVKGAIEAVATLASHEIAETDPELGANLMFFFFREWSELTETPDLDRLVPDLGSLVERLSAADANQYRFFRFDDSGAIKAAFVFLRMDKALNDVPAEMLVLSQAVQTILLWSDTAFAERSPLVMAEGRAAMLRPDSAGLIRAAYDPVLPPAGQDPSMAFRISARIGSLQSP